MARKHELPEEPTEWGDQGLDRRTALRTAGASALAPLAALVGRKQAVAQDAGAPAPKTLFFTAAELAMVDELSEIIVPADAHSPGARAAKVAVEIDRVIGEGPTTYEENAKRRRAWREGLARVDALATEMHGKPFMQATPEQRVAVVTRMAQNESAPKAPEERFFREVKAATVNAYYTSEIGLRKELGYLGNSYLQEFVGTDAKTIPISALLKKAAKRTPRAPKKL